MTVSGTPQTEATDDVVKDDDKSDEELFQEFENAESGADDDDAALADNAGADDDAALVQADGSETDDVESDDDKPSDTQAAQDQDDDPWANATEAQRAAFDAAQAQIKKLGDSERSQRGRVSALQRQVNELMQKASTPERAASDKTDPETKGDGDDDILSSEDFKSFEGEYPEVAKPMKSLISSLQKQVNKQRRELDAIGTDRHLDEVGEQEELLEDEHEDWESVVAADGFVDWLNQQPRHIREAAVRNANEIVDAAEAADVVGRFKAFRSAQDTTGNAGADAPDPAKSGDGKGKSTSLTGKRRRQLESASTTRTGGPGAAHGIPEDGDEEAIWKAFDKQEQREQRQRA